MRLEILIVLIVALVVLPSVASATVVRDAPDEVFPSDEFDVTLTISDIQVGGVVETLPHGFTFVSTDYQWFNHSGQKVAFSLVNTTEIVYTVRASSSTGGMFTGIWEDYLNESDGNIASTTTIVKSSSGTASAITFVSSVSVTLSSIGAGDKGSISLPSELHDEHTFFTLIEITAKDDLSSQVMNMEVYDSTPSGVSTPTYGKVLSYLHVDTGVNEGSISSVDIHFKIKASSVDDPENVVLLRWENGAWQALETSYVKEEGGDYVFVAHSPGLSLYAVAEGGEEEALTSTTSRTSGQDTSGQDTTSEAESPGFCVPLTLLCMVVIAIGYRRYRR